jgi:hypothetical protein
VQQQQQQQKQRVGRRDLWRRQRCVCVCVCVCVYGTYFDNLDGDISELSNAFNIFGNSF